MAAYLIIRLVENNKANNEARSERTLAVLCVYFPRFSQKEIDERVNLSASDTKLFISLFSSPTVPFSLSVSPPLKPNQVCIKLNNALA